MSGEYTPEVVAGLQRMVAAGLPLWGLSPATRITLLNLSENATYALVDADSGRELILRVHRVGWSSEQEIRSELAWIEALHREGVIETALPLPGRNGELVQTLESVGAPRHAVAFSRLAGSEPAAAEAAGPWFEELGAISARMHVHARGWQPPRGFRRRRWDLDAMVGPRAHWGSWRAATGLDASGTAVLEQALALAARRLEHYGSGPERFGLVHADLRLANLLVDGPRLQIIDFDDCGFGWFMYDFATAVSFIEHEPAVPGLLQSWLTGYCRHRPLSPEERAEIATFVALRRILLAAWLASHAEIPFARGFGPAHTADTVLMAQQLLEGKLLPV